MTATKKVDMRRLAPKADGAIRTKRRRRGLRYYMRKAAVRKAIRLGGFAASAATLAALGFAAATPEVLALQGGRAAGLRAAPYVARAGTAMRGFGAPFFARAAGMLNNISLPLSGPAAYDITNVLGTGRLATAIRTGGVTSRNVGLAMRRPIVDRTGQIVGRAATAYNFVPRFAAPSEFTLRRRAAAAGRMYQMMRRNARYARAAGTNVPIIRFV